MDAKKAAEEVREYNKVVYAEFSDDPELMLRVAEALGKHSDTLIDILTSDKRWFDSVEKIGDVTMHTQVHA